jgi:hypothetical protein
MYVASLSGSSEFIYTDNDSDLEYADIMQTGLGQVVEWGRA